MKAAAYTDTKFDATAPMKVDRVSVKWEVDENPDLSYLGEYSNQPADSDVTIDREAAGQRGRNEYRYFIAAMSGSETGNPASVQQDYERFEAYNRGDWQMLGCVAVAEVSYPVGQGSRRIERFNSGGLWGIESDSGSDYREEVEAGQLDDLRTHLEQFGIKWDATAVEVKGGGQ